MFTDEPAEICPLCDEPIRIWAKTEGFIIGEHWNADGRKCQASGGNRVEAIQRREEENDNE